MPIVVCPFTARLPPETSADVDELLVPMSRLPATVAVPPVTIKPLVLDAAEGRVVKICVRWSCTEEALNVPPLTLIKVPSPVEVRMPALKLAAPA